METKDTLSSCSASEEQQTQLKQDKAKKSCMVSFRQLHSHLKLLSNNDFKGTRIECGFKRAFATLFGQDVETFTGTMFLNMDQLEKQLDKEEFQENGSMAAFKVLETQFQMFIKSRIYLDDEYVIMTHKYFLEYTQLEIREFRDTLIQHMESIKKSVDKRALHKREYDNRVNERQMQTTEEEVDTSKALDASLVNTKSSGTELGEQDTSNRSGNDAHADDADIKPVYDKEPMAEVQMTDDDNVFAIGQHHTNQPEFNNEGEVDQNAKQCHDTDTCSLHAKLTDNHNEAKVKHDIDVIETINIELEHKVAKLLKENETLKKHYKELYDSIKTTRAKNIEQTTSLIAKNAEFKAQLQEKGFAITTLKNELRKLTGNSVNTKFAKSSIFGKPVLQPHRNQSVVRQPTAFKSERPRISKPRESRNSSKNMPRFSSNDMVHNHYLDEARKKTQEKEEQTLALNGCTPFNLKKERIKVWIKENVISGRPRLHGTTLIQEISARPKIHIKMEMETPHSSRTKTFANSDIQDLPSRYQDYQDKDCQGRLLASFLDDAKYEHVGQDTRSQDGKDDQDKQGKDLKIMESKTKSKDN
ncbi:hypothetical protein Tco_1448472 [Tanacetum coccineum]